MRIINATDVDNLLSLSGAINAINDRMMLLGDAAAGAPRGHTPLRAGEMLVMPAESATAVGVKIVSVAPGNQGAGLPRIQAVFVLFDAGTLTPEAVIDGTALTSLRTPAQSAVAVQHLAVRDAQSLVVFGTGPQAAGHVHAVRAVRPVREVTIVGRSSDRTRSLVERLAVEGVPAQAGTASAVAGADIVVCATTARTPLFDGKLLTSHACVVAIGSHEPGARELDSAVFSRASRVVVEGRDVALREAGDVIMAIGEGALTSERLVEVAELPRLPSSTGISVFKGVGVGWQDLAVAEAVHNAWLNSKK